MIHLLGLLFLVHCVQYVTSQITMVESGPGTVKPTETLELTCKVSGASLTDSTNMYGVHWIRQSERKQMEWLGVIVYNAGTQYATSVQGRLTLSTDTNKGEVYFKLTGMKTEESGKYYCARHLTTYYNAMDVWGPGTFVTVTAAVQSAPSVFPMAPCKTSSPEITIGCLSTGYLPEPVDVTWNSGSITTGIKSLPGVLSKHGNYISSSYLTIPTSNWKSNKYTCNVNHKASSQNINKDIPVFPTDIFHNTPNIEVLLPSCGNKAEGDIPVMCLVSNIKSEKPIVIWLNNGKPLETTDFKLLQDDNGFHFAKSSLNISVESWNKDEEYTCQVKTMTENYMQNISKCSACPASFPTPTVEVELPSSKDLQSSNYIIKCSVLGNPDPSSVYLKFDVKIPNKKSTKHTRVNNQQVVYSFEVTSEEWKSINEVSCVVKQPCSMPEVSEKKKKNLEKPPSIKILASCCDGSDTGTVTLVSTISNFWPQTISVNWLKNGEPYPSSTPISTMTDSNGNYAAISILNISRESWDQEETYTCQVNHQEKMFKENISKCKDPLLLPDGYIQKPSFKDLFVLKTANVSCKTNLPYVNIRWMLNGKEKRSSYKGKQKPGNSTWVESTLQISLEEWKTVSSLSCKLHPPKPVLQEKMTITRSNDAKEMKTPSVYLLPPTPESIAVKDNLTLVCLVQDFYPEDLFVTWEANGKISKNDVPDSSSISCNHREKHCMFTSQLPILKSEWLINTSYSCLVAHISSGVYIRKNISAESIKLEYLPVKPEHYIVKPSFKNVFDTKIAEVKCETNEVKNSLSWLVNGTEKAELWERTSKQNMKEGQQWIESTIKIPLAEWKALSTLSCKLSQTQQLQNITNPNMMKRPRVYILTTNDGNGTEEEEQMSLICLVKAFYPEDIFVTWNVNYTIIQEDIPSPKDVTCNHESQQCSFVSELSILKEDWDAGKIYMCQVAHISSEIYYIKNVSNVIGETTQPNKPLSTNNCSFYHDDGGEDLSESEEINSIWSTSSTFIALFLLTLIYSSCVTFVKVK